MNIIVGNAASALNITVIRGSGYGEGSFWDNTKDDYGLNKFQTSFYNFNTLIEDITFNLIELKINNIIVFSGEIEYYIGESGNDYSFRDDGYGLAASTYADIATDVLEEYNLRSRILPGLVGEFNTKENFEIKFLERANGISSQTIYSIRSQFGQVADSVDGNYFSWG